MDRPTSRAIYRIFGLAIVFCLVATLVTAASLKEEVARKNSELAERKKSIQTLTAKERTLHKDLAKLEKSVMDAAAALDRLESESKALEKKQAESTARLASLLAERDAASARLSELIQSLWPIYLKAREDGFPSAATWAEANRKAEWLSALYREAQAMREEIERQSQIVADEQSTLDEAAAKLAAHQVKIEDSKAALQKKKSSYEAQIKDVRARRAQDEKMVKSLLDSIATLRHEISLQASKRISGQGGKLPWPARGKVVVRYAPGSNPPCNGLGMALEPGAPVRSVSWGKVVHNDQLRGFGQVVVVFHGEDYYSLYAFLSDAPVPVGREVNQGDQIGVCGFYPKAQGPGLYFELRFRQKAINPFKWLQSG